MSAPSKKTETGLVDSVTGLRNGEAFREDVDKELARAHRYGYRIAVLLAELDGYPANEEQEIRRESEQSVATRLRDILRAGDAMYSLTRGRFAAILPFTTETGGETAALRLKRAISHAVLDFDSKPISLSVGIASIHPHDELVTSQDVLRLAEKDLDQDKRCQAYVPVEASQETVRRRNHPTPRAVQEAPVLIISGEAATLRRMSGFLSKRGFEVYTAGTCRQAMTLLSQVQASLIILDNETARDTETAEFCSLVRSSVKGEEPYIILLSSDETDAATSLIQITDDVLRKPLKLSELLARVRIGARLRDLSRQLLAIERLSSALQMAGAAAHELKQPLQVILGKAELLLLEMNEDDPSYGAFSDIRKQIFRMAHITQKLGRITRHELTDQCSSF